MTYYPYYATPPQRHRSISWSTAVALMVALVVLIMGVVMAIVMTSPSSSVPSPQTAAYQLG